MKGSLVGKSLEKQTLFSFLEPFLLSRTHDPEVAEIRQAYGTAQNSESHESFLNLVEKIYTSKLLIPGFTIVNAPSVHGYALTIKFDNPIVDGLQESNDELRSRVEFYQIKNEKKLEILESKHEEQIHNLKDDHATQIESLRANLYTMWSEREEKDTLARLGFESADMLDNTNDAFSFIMVSPFSIEGFVAMIVYVLQMASFTFIVLSLWQSSAADGTYPIPIDLTKGVEPTVHAAQAFAIFVIVLVQQSIWESTADLSNGYNKHLKDQGIKYKWWLLSSLMRLSEGLYCTFVTFLLVLTSENVVELFKDFTAMTFISSFDNIVYELANMKVIGKYMKRVADRCNSVTYRTVVRSVIRRGVSNKKQYAEYFFYRYILRPFTLVFFLLITMYISWIILILIPHLQGKYVCSKLYVQLDDRVRPELSYFSGTYEKIKNRDNNFMLYYHSYKEVRTHDPKNQGKPYMYLYYCLKDSKWMFLRDTPQLNGCEEGNTIIESAKVEDQQKFDLFEVGFDDWEVENEDGVMMPLEELRITCQDNEDRYSITNSTMSTPETFIMNNSTVCNDLTTDQRLEPFVSTRKWSTDYKMFLYSGTPVTVYSHPVYYAQTNNSTEIELIFFLGKRWVISTDNNLRDYKRNKTENTLETLATYLQNDFHGFWSEYIVSFITEPVLAQTIKDKSSPDELSWYPSTPYVKGKKQVAYENQQENSMFLCKNCNNETNLCFNNGTCPVNGICVCDNGSDGNLCEVIPVRNGFCDTNFNFREYDYDGGDCCIDTCVSRDGITCGKDTTGKFYVGYDVCVNEDQDNCGNPCWRNTDSLTLSSLYVSFASLSQDGRILAVIEVVSQTVRIYENNGREWTLRGSAVSEVTNAVSDLVEVSSRNSVMNSPRKLSPVTVAVKTERELNVYDWEVFYWKKEQVLEGNVTAINLRNEGNTLGVLCNGNFILFDRGDDSSQWHQRVNITNITKISLSEDGKKFALATKRALATEKECVHVYNYSRPQNETLVASKCDIESNGESNGIRNLKISSDGNILVVLIYYRKKIGNIQTFNISGNEILLRGTSLRGIHVDSQVEILPNSCTVAVLSPLDDGVTFFKLDETESKWTSENEGLFSKKKKISISTDGSTMVLISSKGDLDNGENFLRVFHMPEKCPNDHLNVRLSFLLDDNANELKWEYINATTSGFVEVMKQGGPYSEENALIVDEMCVSDSIIHSTMSSDVCIGIRIYDLGLDGLSSPGEVAVTVNGTIMWNVSGTEGYEHVFPLFGSESCMEFLKNTNNGPWIKYEESLHEKCLHDYCTWENMMFPYPNNTPYNKTSTSADGTVVAMARIVNKTAEVDVFKHRYNESQYTHYGQRINITLSGSYGGGSVSLSLSADGSDIAIGVSNTENSSNSHIYVYFYNETEWVQRGNSFMADESDSFRLGFSVSLSSSGKKVAITHEKKTNNLEELQVDIYRYGINGGWENLPSIRTDWEKSQMAPVVKLSSSGMVVALSNPYQVISPSNPDQEYNSLYRAGQVQVYSYDDYDDTWRPRGQVFTGESPQIYLGASMSLSADGSTLAISKKCNLKVAIFRYNADSDKYEPLGDEISMIRESDTEFEQNDGCLTDVSLSSSGNVVVVSEGIATRLYSFDEHTSSWIESLVKINDREKDNTSTSEKSSRVSVSADALTLVTVSEDGPVKVYRLRNVGDSSCSNGTKFTFILNPDNFPQDINWYLMEEGTTAPILRERLQAATDKTKNYISCLNNDKFYRFYIEDSYGDGICCDWGQGNFTVTLNDTTILDIANSSFKTKEYACLPLSSEKSIFSVEYLRDPTYRNFKWAIIEGREAIARGDAKDEIWSQVDNHLDFHCVPSNTCLYFLTEFESANVFPNVTFTAEYNNEVIRKINNFNETQSLSRISDNEFDSLTSYDLSRTKFCQECESDEVLIQWVLYSGTEEHTSWKLLNHSEVLYEKNRFNHSEADHYYYYDRCVRVTEYNCLSLEISDAYSGGQHRYTVWINNILKADKFAPISEKKYEISLEDCYCLSNHKNLTYEYSTDGEQRVQFVLERLNGTVMNDPEWIDDGRYVSKAECYSVEDDECLNFIIRDTNVANTTNYKVYWENELVQHNTLTQAFDRIPLGECSIADICGEENKTLFELDVVTDATAIHLLYELSVGEERISKFEDYDNNFKFYYRTECLQVNQNECASLVLVKAYDEQPGSGTVFDNVNIHHAVSWNREVVEDNVLMNKPLDLVIVPNNCVVTSCGENESLFEIYTYHGDATSCDYWELKDKNNNTLANFSFDNDEEFKYHTYRKCVAVPQNECATLKFKNYYDYSLAVAWNGKIVIEVLPEKAMLPDYYTNEYQIGDCPPLDSL